MNAIDALEGELAADPYGALREHLAANDDQFVEDLVSMRKTKKLTQDVVASRMNRSKTAVSNFERLGADPRLSTIRRYAAAVGACVVTSVTDYDLEFTDSKVIFVSIGHPKRKSSSDHPDRESGDSTFGTWVSV